MGDSITACARASRRIYELAGASYLQQVGAGNLARDLFGDDSLTYARDLLAPTFRLQRLSPDDPPKWLIILRRGMSDAAVNMAIARGIATWWYTVEGTPICPELLDDLVAHLVVPVPALRVKVGRRAPDPEALAAKFLCPKSLVVAQLRHLIRPLRSCIVQPPVRLGRPARASWLKIVARPS